MLDHEIIQHQKYLNIFIGLVAVLLIAFVFVLIKSNSHKQRMNVLLDRKVVERTHDLQLNRDTQLRACEERDLIINKASKDIKTSLLTLSGLCTVGLQDVQDPKALEYISMMKVASEGFSAGLRQLDINKNVNFDLSLTPR